MAGQEWPHQRLPQRQYRPLLIPALETRERAWLVQLKRAGEQHVVLYPSTMAKQPPLVISPGAGSTSEYNWFGFRRQIQPLH
jgi:hypothetical protein